MAQWTGSYKHAIETSRAVKGRETPEQLLETEPHNSQSRVTVKCGHETRGTRKQDAGEAQQQFIRLTDRRSSCSSFCPFFPRTLLYGLTSARSYISPITEHVEKIKHRKFSQLDVNFSADNYLFLTM
jgi:hypothetical protein